MIWVCGTASGCLDDATSVGTQWTAQARGRGLQGRSLKNRPGNVHDSKQAVPFLRDIIEDLRGP